MIQSLFYKHNQDIAYEDPRTSTVFDALLHLPDQLLWEILRDACYVNNVLPRHPGKLEYYGFWPKWKAQETGNARYVEPDVFLRFTGAHLIIEAKRSDEGGQEHEEWKREWIAYENTFGVTDIPVFLIAIGGNGNNTSKETMGIRGKERTIVKCSWVNLHERLLEKHKELDGSEWRVVDSLLLACVLFGFKSFKWLDARPWVSAYRIAIQDDYHTLIFKR